MDIHLETKMDDQWGKYLALYWVSRSVLKKERRLETQSVLQWDDLMVDLKASLLGKVKVLEMVVVRGPG